MSEHTANPRALMAASIPPLLPVGCQWSVDLQLQVIPKVNVMLVPADKMRVTPEGGIEVLAGEPAQWRTPPAGVEVHELGKPLPADKCDVVAVIGSLVEDTLAPKLLSPGQKQPQGRVSSAPIGIIARTPMEVWQARHLKALRGMVK